MEKLIKAVEATEEGDGYYGEFNYALEVTREVMKDTEEGYRAYKGYGKYN